MRGAPDGHQESPHSPSGRPLCVARPKALSPWVFAGFANVQRWQCLPCLRRCRIRVVEVDARPLRGRVGDQHGGAVAAP